MTSDSAKSPGAGAEVAAVELVNVTIDDVQVAVPKDTLVIRAAELIGVEIPRFCDHPLLEPIGACRQCLVEVTDAGNGRPFPKPQASCTLPVAEGMVVKTQVTSPVADKAQHGNMEFLLINHPLDCPVCDKGGECPLQNQALTHGRGETRFHEVKRTFPKPINVSAQVLLDRERCVLCARCTRFSEQVAGDPFIAFAERGALMQVAIYEREPFESYFSGNTIQICPVGALTSAAYRFRARPFDLVSSPSVCEHCASGCALRVDHRRGKVTRRLAGDDPAVNEEWNCDKGRFAFLYPRSADRLTHPMVRDPGTGELGPASWPEAFIAAARGLAAARGRVGVLTGGRLTGEDAYAYAKFARAVLGTNDIDFRARVHSAEEASFLASTVAATHLSVTYADLERATTVVLAGLEPEDESPIVFLRLRKAFRQRGTRVYAVASHTTRGLDKVGGTLVRTRPGDEARALTELAAPSEVALDGGGVILVGERLAGSPGALSAAADLAARTGAKLAWVPRRAGERGAVEAGCLPNLLPGGRPVADASARADVAAAWRVGSLPATAGRDTDGIVAAVLAGELTALVVGGVELADLPDPGAALAAVGRAGFVVSLELLASEVSARADVVFPVAAAAEKSGLYVDWEGRVRPFECVLRDTGALPDLRVLAGVAEELADGLGFRTVEQTRAEMVQLGPWDGAREPAPRVEARPVDAPSAGTAVLSTWRQLLDDGRLQQGDPYLAATARKIVARVPQSMLDALELRAGAEVVLRTKKGAVALPTEVADLPDGVVWAPHNSGGVNLAGLLGVGAGQQVGVERGAQ
ncbi:MAG: NADH-quinone oxidoreductase subunit G [Nocardioidaceae bacterium]